MTESPSRAITIPPLTCKTRECRPLTFAGATTARGRCNIACTLRGARPLPPDRLERCRTVGEMPSFAVPVMQGLSIEAVEWLPSGAESGLVRVRGRWAAGEPPQPGLPSLVLRSEGRDHRFDSLPDARFERDPASWRGSYLVPTDLVAVEPDTMWIEWSDGARAGLPAMTRGIEPPSPDAPEKPTPPTTPGGAQVIDRAVLAERRARRAEAGEQAQARIAAEALKAVEALELRAAELERRLEDVTPAGPDPAAEAALAEAARLRGEVVEWRRHLRLAEAARVEAVSAAAGHERARTAAVADVRADAERRAAGVQAIHAEVRADLERRLADEQARRAESEQAALTLRRDVAQAGRTTGDLRRRLEEAQAVAVGASERVAAAEAAAELVEAKLRAELAARAALEAELDRERAARRDAEAALAATQAESERTGATLLGRIAELERQAAEAPDADRLERVAREQAAAAAARPASQDGAELAARLDAAAAALRTRTPAPAPAPPPPDPPAATAPTIVSPASPPPRADAVGASQRDYPVLRGALVKLAHDEPKAAGRLLAGLLPAQAAAFAGPLSYDLTIREVGTFTVDIADGAARATRVPKPRGRRNAAFHLTADALTLAELLAGVDHRIGRFRGPARIRGRRRQHAPLRAALTAAELSLADAARAGATLEPGLAWQALSYAIHPSWTSGLRFTVATTVERTPTWFLTARDGGGLAASTAQPETDPSATVAMSRAAFDRMLRGEPHPPGERPAVRGDRVAVGALLELVMRVRG
jgi:hypothetical protein